MLSLNLYSQITISSEYIEAYVWDEEKNEWGDLFFEEEKYVFFEFNEEFTSLEFTSFDTKSTYLLTNPEYSEAYGHYSYEATSDRGYETSYIIDLKSDTPNIRVIMKLKDSTLLIRYTVKSWFKDEE